MKTSLVLITVSALTAPLVPAANLVGHWTFENASDLTEATIGSALTLNGTTSATTGVGGDGAIDVATGTASWISVPNPIGANGATGTPTRTNQYSIVLDFQIPDFKDGGADNGQFTGIFDFDGGGSDGDFFIRKQANATELGVSTQWPYLGAGPAATGDGTTGTVRSGTWYRLVLAADVGVGRSVYLNGNLIGNYAAGTQDAVRQSLTTAFRVLWDNTAAENSRAIISNIALFDARLTPAEVTILGSAGDSLVLPNPEELTWTGEVSGEWSENVLASPKNWVLTSDGTTESDFENFDTVLFPDGATATTVSISNGDVQPLAVTFDSDTAAYTLTGTNGISGSTGMVISGDASFRIENANTFTGTTDHSGFGNLTLANQNALQNSTLITYSGNGYFFDGISSASLGGLSGNADIVLENSASAALALTLGSSGNASYSGILSGSGSILKTGSGRQTLVEANSYTGGTTVASGILSVGNATGLGTGSVTLGGILEFEIASGTESTFSNNVTLPPGAAFLRMFGSFGPGRTAPTPGTATRLTGKISGGDAGSTFRFGDTGLTGEHDNITILDNATNDFVGLIQQWRSVLSFTSDGALGDVENDIEINCANYNGGLRFGASVALGSTRSIGLVSTEVISSDTFTGTINGPVTGAGSLRKLGSGTLVLANAANSYAGVTQVNEGTLQVDGTLATGGGTVTVGAAGTLGGNGTVDRAITVTGAIAPGASVGTLAVGNTDIVGTLDVEIDGATKDLLAVTGNITLGAASVLDITEINTGTAFPYVIATYTGTLTGTFLTVTPGYSVNYGTGSNSQITIDQSAGFTAWASANAPGQTIDQDHDNDGVSNGIEYFMGQSGNGFTALPALSGLTASWTKGGAYTGVYGTDYVVQTSENLVDWTDITSGDPNLTNGSPLEYTIPGTDPKTFVRLKVTGP